MKNKIHIVGLRYYSWCGHMDELFAPDAPANDKWIGQKLFLQHASRCCRDFFIWVQPLDGYETLQEKIKKLLDVSSVR